MAKEKKAAPRFTRQRLLEMSRYKARRDLLNAILADSKTYTIEAVDALIEKFMKGTVS